MKTITVPLTDEQLRQLREMAERAGVSPEELARASLEEFLRQPHAFSEAAEYVLQKDAEFYRRLG